MATRLRNTMCKLHAIYPRGEKAKASTGYICSALQNATQHNTNIPTTWTGVFMRRAKHALLAVSMQQHLFVGFVNTPRSGKSAASHATDMETKAVIHEFNSLPCSCKDLRLVILGRAATPCHKHTSLHTPSAPPLPITAPCKVQLQMPGACMLDAPTRPSQQIIRNVCARCCLVGGLELLLHPPPA
jgi:hypothetical protein